MLHVSLKCLNQDQFENNPTQNSYDDIFQPRPENEVGHACAFQQTVIRERNSKAILLTKIKIGGTWLLLKKLFNGRELLKLSLMSINHGSQLQPSEV